MEIKVENILKNCQPDFTVSCSNSSSVLSRERAGAVSSLVEIQGVCCTEFCEEITAGSHERRTWKAELVVGKEPAQEGTGFCALGVEVADDRGDEGFSLGPCHPRISGLNRSFWLSSYCPGLGPGMASSSLSDPGKSRMQKLPSRALTSLRGLPKKHRAASSHIGRQALVLALPPAAVSG